MDKSYRNHKNDSEKAETLVFAQEFQLLLKTWSSSRDPMITMARIVKPDFTTEVAINSKLAS